MKKLLVVMLPLIVTSCVSSRIHTDSIQPHVREIKNEPYVVLAVDERSVSNLNLFWVVTVTEKPNIDLLLREMIAEHDGDAVIDVRVWKEYQVWLLSSITIWHVRGKVVRYIPGLP